MASPYPHSDRELIRLIGRASNGRAGYKQLVRELGLGGGRERRLLVEQLTRIVARGELVRDTRDDTWSLPRRESASPSHRPDRFPDRAANDSSRLISGRLDLHRDGFGFVRVDKPVPGATGDIFIPPNDLGGAMQGDLVLVDEAAPDREGRRSGRIHRVLTRRNPTVVGIFHYAEGHSARRRARDSASSLPTALLRGNYITPIDERVASLVVIPEGDEVPTVAATPHRTLGKEATHTPRTPKDPSQPLEGLAVDVEITAFPTATRPAQGRVIEVLGHPEDFGVDVEIIIRKHAIPHTFPAAVLAEAEQESARTVAALTAEELAEREDFRQFPVVTIDGETAKDFDDAVHVRPLADGHTELQVHIADVSHYVRPDTPLDIEARMRGTSVYFPDRAVPMLPAALSSGMCSLLPHEDRLVLSCIMDIDAAGEITSFRIAEGIIRSAARLTYTQVQHEIDGVESTPPAPPIPGASLSSSLDDPLLSSRSASLLSSRSTSLLSSRSEAEGSAFPPTLAATVHAMLALAHTLNAKRVRRGSIDFDLPEPVVQFDPDGNMAAIVKSERGWSHRLIEEFMLSANECVAHWLEAQGIASLYRIHEMPDPKRILEFEETAAAFGQSLGIGSLPVKRLTMKADRRDAQRKGARGHSTRAPQAHEVPQSIPVTPQMYQRLVRKISGHPEERILAYLMLRSLKQARYAEKNEGHFALASPSYTHFTSPIRRYPDLIVHRLLRAMLHAGVDPAGFAIRSTDPQPWSRHGSGIGDQGSEKPRPRPVPYSPTPAPLAPQELTAIAAESSQAERRAADAERELIEWKKLKFMADKVGDDFHAVILSVTKYGFFVELDELFIEGLVPLASLTHDRYFFRDTDRTLCAARTGHCFRIGDRVEVILDRIDRQQRRLQFALLPGTEPQGETRAARPSSSATKKKKVKKQGKQRKKR